MGFEFHGKKGAYIMKCFMCKGRLRDKPTTYMVEKEKRIIIIKNVPSQVCGQCGETSYNHDTAKRLEKIIDQLSLTLTEIAVVNYFNEVA